MAKQPFTKGLSTKELKDFKKVLKQAETSNDVEKATEHAYVEVIEKFYKNKNKKDETFEIEITYPHNTDGLIKIKNIGLFYENDCREALILLETKRDMNFSKKEEQAKAIAQVIYYLKNFEKSGKKVKNGLLLDRVGELKLAE